MDEGRRDIIYRVRAWPHRVGRAVHTHRKNTHKRLHAHTGQ